MLKDIPGYENLYAASEDGRIWAYPRQWVGGQGGKREHKGLWLSPALQKDGYLMVYFTVDGKRKYGAVARLVALAFIPNPENKPCINHKDFNRTNNSVENLEWCTLKENTQHSLKAGRMPQSELKYPDKKAHLREYMRDYRTKKNKRIDFRFSEVEMEALDFFKAVGIPYSQTICKALEEYYRNHHRNTKLGDIGKPLVERDPEESYHELD